MKAKRGWVQLFLAVGLVALGLARAAGVALDSEWLTKLPKEFFISPYPLLYGGTAAFYRLNVKLTFDDKSEVSFRSLKIEGPLGRQRAYALPLLQPKMYTAEILKDIAQYSFCFNDSPVTIPRPDDDAKSPVHSVELEIRPFATRTGPLNFKWDCP